MNFTKFQTTHDLIQAKIISILTTRKMTDISLTRESSFYIKLKTQSSVATPAVVLSTLPMPTDISPDNSFTQFKAPMPISSKRKREDTEDLNNVNMQSAKLPPKKRQRKDIHEYIKYLPQPV